VLSFNLITVTTATSAVTVVSNFLFDKS